MITAVEVEVAMLRPPTDKEIAELDAIFGDTQLEEGEGRWYVIATTAVKEGEEVPSEECIDSLVQSVLGDSAEWWLSEIWDLEDELGLQVCG